MTRIHNFWDVATEVHVSTDTICECWSDGTGSYFAVRCFERSTERHYWLVLALSGDGVAREVVSTGWVCRGSAPDQIEFLQAAKYLCQSDLRRSESVASSKATEVSDA